MNYNLSGLLKCARYSLAPNQLHFCGPEKQVELLGYVSHDFADKGLGKILNQFDTLYKYLVFIASENGCKDPFDPRVVEAYWLGNDLLHKKNIRALASHLSDTLELKKKLTTKQFGRLLMKTANGFPHHTFHVLNIYQRTGHLSISHTLETMDNCRIGWGQVIGKETDTKKSLSRKISGPEGSYLYIKTNPLIFENDKLKLGAQIIKQVFSLIKNINVGDFVSFHWGVVCEQITKLQKQRLQYYTLQAIRLANF